MTKKKFKKNKLYKITFYDHVMSDKVDPLMVVTVCGWVRKDDNEVLSISTWETHTDIEQVKLDNDSIYNIAKRLITSSRLMK